VSLSRLSAPAWLLGVALLGAGPAAADPGGWQRTLDGYVRPAGVDYARVAQDKPLDAYLVALARTPPPGDRAGAMAYWINAYNALTVDLIADHWPLGSIRELDGGQPWKRRRFEVGGRSVTLDEIEHQILRPLGDPRVHAALNCASRGCPPLRPRAMSAAGLEAELDAAARAWVQGGGAVYDPASKTLRLSSIFDWFAEDFAVGPAASVPGLRPREAALAAWVARYSPPAQAAALRAGGYRVEFVPYDWTVNRAP
jgi:hypothetical protein